MAKARIKENHTISVEGILNIDENDEPKMEIEGVGSKTIAELLKNFNGCPIVLSAKHGVEINE